MQSDTTEPCYTDRCCELMLAYNEQVRSARVAHASLATAPIAIPARQPGHGDEVVGCPHYDRLQAYIRELGLNSDTLDLRVQPCPAGVCTGAQDGGVSGPLSTSRRSQLALTYCMLPPPEQLFQDPEGREWGCAYITVARKRLSFLLQKREEFDDLPDAKWGDFHAEPERVIPAGMVRPPMLWECECWRLRIWSGCLSPSVRRWSCEWCAWCLRPTLPAQVRLRHVPNSTRQRCVCPSHCCRQIVRVLPQRLLKTVRME